MEIVLEKVKESEKAILYRLLQYSLFEERGTDQNEMNQEALFDYPWFDAYFTEAERDAFFIREQESGKLLGFAMINTYVQRCDFGHSIAEFMILPKFRRGRIGTKAARLCLDQYEGNWEISPAVGSEPAYLFWKQVIEAYTDGAYRFEDGMFEFSVFNEL